MVDLGTGLADILIATAIVGVVAVAHSAFDGAADIWMLAIVPMFLISGLGFALGAFVHAALLVVFAATVAALALVWVAIRFIDVRFIRVIVTTLILGGQVVAHYFLSQLTSVT